MSESPSLPQGPGFGITFLYYFSGLALVTTLLATQTLGLALDTGIPNQFGLVVGSVGGLLGALANRSQTLTLPCPDPKKFQQNLEAALTAMGYSRDPEADLEGILVYRRPPLRQLFSGKVYVLLENDQAHISSRVVHLRGLKSRLELAAQPTQQKGR